MRHCQLAIFVCLMLWVNSSDADKGKGVPKEKIENVKKTKSKFDNKPESQNFSYLSAFDRKSIYFNDSEKLNRIPDNVKTPPNLIIGNSVNKISKKVTNLFVAICSNSVQVASALGELRQEISNSKDKVQEIKRKNVKTNLRLPGLTQVINEVNLVRTELYRIKGVLDSLLSSKCERFEELRKQYEKTISETARIVEFVKEKVNSSDLNLNIVNL